MLDLIPSTNAHDTRLYYKISPQLVASFRACMSAHSFAAVLMIILGRQPACSIHAPTCELTVSRPFFCFHDSFPLQCTARWAIAGRPLFVAICFASFRSIDRIGIGLISSSLTRMPHVFNSHQLALPVACSSMGHGWLHTLLDCFCVTLHDSS